MKIQIVNWGSWHGYPEVEIGIVHRNGKLNNYSVVDKKRFMLAVIKHNIQYKKAAKLKRANRMSKKKRHTSDEETRAVLDLVDVKKASNKEFENLVNNMGLIINKGKYAWVFEIADPQLWMLSKIKYGI